MPNFFAYFMLAIWPFVVLVMFRRMPIERALVWSFFAGMLVLPPVAAIEMPMIPDLNKNVITTLSAFFCVLMIKGRSGLLPQSRLARLLLLIFLFSPFATVLTNREPIMFAVGGIPGLTLYDAITITISQFVVILAMLLARRVLATPEALHEVLKALAVAGLVYSIPMLYEARMSPQLNVMIYGYFQHEFLQSMRFGGFRPFVFTEHGLLLAFYTLCMMTAAATLARYASPAMRIRWILATLYLGLMLLICRSLGPIVYACAMIPLVLFASPRWQARVSVLLATIVIAYPILRGADLVPIEEMLSMAESVETDRADSLQFRFEHEAMLLARAQEKPIFGWGSWGRNMVYEHETGRSITVSDGRWVIVIGVAGWVGYIGEFGLLALPLFMLSRQLRGRPSEAGRYAGTLALILAFNMVDLLPNASLFPFTWLIAGTVLGYAESLRAQRAEAKRLEGRPAAARAASPAGPQRLPPRAGGGKTSARPAR